MAVFFEFLLFKLFLFCGGKLKQKQESYRFQEETTKKMFC